MQKMKTFYTQWYAFCEENWIITMLRMQDFATFIPGLMASSMIPKIPAYLLHNAPLP
jgi:hypothetical protein